MSLFPQLVLTCRICETHNSPAQTKENQQNPTISVHKKWAWIFLPKMHKTRKLYVQVSDENFTKLFWIYSHFRVN